MAAPRISHEPAYVLHRYDWSESSLILEVFTRAQGRIALAAKGVKRPSSNFRPVLLPLQPLEIAFSGAAEIRALKSAEWVGGHVMPTGDALLSGLYLNELLLRLLARDDPHPRLFDVYAAAVRVLAFSHGDALEPALRAFELLLLRNIGLLPLLDRQTLTLAPLAAGARYTLVPDGGLRAADASEQRSTLSAAEWLSLQRALDDQDAPFLATVQACAALLPGLKPQLRALLNHCSGGVPLRTRQMMIELQKL